MPKVKCLESRRRTSRITTQRARLLAEMRARMETCRQLGLPYPTDISHFQPPRSPEPMSDSEATEGRRNLSAWAVGGKAGRPSPSPSASSASIMSRRSVGAAWSPLSSPNEAPSPPSLSPPPPTPSSPSSGGQSSASRNSDSHSQDSELDGLLHELATDLELGHFSTPRPDLLEQGNDSQLFRALAKAFVLVRTRHAIPQRACQELYEVMVRYAESISRAKRRGAVRKSIVSAMRGVASEIPQVWSVANINKWNRPGARLLSTKPSTKLKRAVLHKKVARIDSRVKLRELAEFVWAIHGVEKDNGKPRDSKWLEITVHSDEAQKGRLRHKILQYINVSFDACGEAHPWQISEINLKLHRRPKAEKWLARMAREIRDSGLRVTRYNADGKERKVVKMMTSTNGYFFCDFCCGDGDYIDNRVCMPYERYKDAERRTIDQYREHAARYQEVLEDVQAGRLSRGEFRERLGKGEMGVVSASPLVDIPGFDLIAQCQVDPFHQADIGVTSKLTAWLLSPKEMSRRVYLQGAPSRTKKEVKERLSKSSPVVDRLLHKLRVPSEFDFRTRAINVGDYKGKDYKFITLYLSVYLSSLKSLPCEDRVLWALYGFYMRALNLPEQDYHQLARETDLREIADELFCTYETTFGEQESTYNEHLLGSHAVEAREEHGPIYLNSTEKFEALIGRCQKCFVGGALHATKQIFTNFYLGQSDVQRHVCPKSKRLRLSSRRTARSDDRLVVSSEGQFLLIKDMSVDDVLLCHPVITAKYKFHGLDWAHVGVARYRGVDENSMIRKRRFEIVAKAVKVGNLILSVKREWIWQ